VLKEEEVGNPDEAQNTVLIAGPRTMGWSSIRRLLEEQMHLRLVGRTSAADETVRLVPHAGWISL
jgi:hypothetical protein